MVCTGLGVRSRFRDPNGSAVPAGRIIGGVRAGLRTAQGLARCVEAECVLKIRSRLRHATGTPTNDKLSSPAFPVPTSLQHPYFAVGVRPALSLDPTPQPSDRPASHSAMNGGKDATNIEVRGAVWGVQISKGGVQAGWMSMSRWATWKGMCQAQPSDRPASHSAMNGGKDATNIEVRGAVWGVHISKGGVRTFWPAVPRWQTGKRDIGGQGRGQT